ARLGDDKGGRFDNYCQILMNRRPVLAPGDAIDTTTTLDIGPIRETLIRSASWSTSVEIAAMFDPMQTEQGIAKGLSTVEAKPRTARREGLPRDLPGVKRLVLALNDAPLSERLRAIDALGALLAETERLSSTPPDDGVKVEAIQKRLIPLLNDPNWLIRACVLEALRWSKQPENVLAAAAKTIRDPNFVVQMMGIRFFVQQQGDRFRKVLESLANDADEQCVRILAKSYLSPVPAADPQPPAPKR